MSSAASTEEEERNNTSSRERNRRAPAATFVIFQEQWEDILAARLSIEGESGATLRVRDGWVNFARGVSIVFVFDNSELDFSSRIF